MNQYDIITFGSASQDIFVFSKTFFDKDLCFPLGEKIEVDKILTHTGGGGTNTAATFALQGLKTAYCGSVGKDCAGFSILLNLKRFGISTEFLNSLSGKTTNHSVILSKQEKGRVILVHRDASNYLPKNFSLRNLNAQWFYLAPLNGEMAKITREIIDFANLHKIKIAFNPGKEQIQLLKRDTRKWLPKIDVLIMNDKEAAILFNDYEKPEKAFKTIKTYLKKNGLFITGSGKGIIAFDGNNVYKYNFSSNQKIADMTGAGDALGAGLITGLIKTNDIISALQLAVANSSACIQKWGAKEGLLKVGQNYQKIKIEVKRHEGS